MSIPQPSPHNMAVVRTGGSAARAIAPYRPTKLISSTAARCVSTIEPVAALAGLDVKATAAISQDAYEDGEADVRRIIAKRIARRETAVLCSHGPVLPVIIDEIADASGGTVGGRLRRAGVLATGEFAVIHLSSTSPQDGIVAVETHAPPEY